LKLTTIILTYNEGIHISRCLESLTPLNSRLIVIDSFSTDNTKDIVRDMGIEFYQNPFVNQAQQIQWALDNCDIKTDWILRVDADEYLSEELQQEINNELIKLAEDVSGVLIKRRVVFMGKWIRWGGYYPIWILRLWKNSKGRIEQKWMDEQIIIHTGKTIEFKNDFIEENLNNLTWWTEKHNNYSNRELGDILRAESSKNYKRGNKQSGNQWAKWNYYYKLPILLRPIIYFLYRYIFKLGFLDGRSGFIWHVLQGFWYRMLIDAKLFQIKYLAKKKQTDPITIYEQETDIKLDKQKKKNLDH